MQNLNPSQLKDLSTLYVGLAKGADDQFHYKELHVIRDRLGTIAGEQEGDRILEMLEEVLSQFDGSKEAREQLVHDSLERLDEVLSDDSKREVLSNLSRIGLADRRFLHAEAEFIHRVSEAWNVHPLEGLSDSWSILGEGGIEGESLRALALLYLVMAYAPDDEISEAERACIYRQLANWIPETSTAEIELALKDAMADFITRSTDDIVHSATETIRRLVPEHQHAVIFEDLKNIAQADDVMLVEERTWLRRLGIALGLVQE